MSAARALRRLEGEWPDLRLDEKVYASIVADMRKYASDHAPGPRWRMEALFGAGDARAESPTFDDMVAPWLGQKAMRPVTGADYATYQPYLDEIDTLEILAQYYPDGRYRDSAGLRVTDLGTIIDVNLIETYAGPDGRERTRFLEVGGGYGRLAEAVLGIWPHRVCYVMVDAVPASIYFSYAYLSACFPDRRIGWYYGGDAFEPDAFDCYVVPTWHFDRVNADTRYDVCVNVASLQEMEDRQVVHYLALFDRMTRVGGTIHLSNSRDFIEPRRYDYPSNWELLYKRNTPRSWTPYYPVEVFRRTDEDCTAGNGVLEARYLEDLRIAYQARVAGLEAQLARTLEANQRLRSRLDDVKDPRRWLKALLGRGSDGAGPRR